MNPLLDVNRRDFLKGGSLSTLMMLMGGVELRAQGVPDANAAKKPEPPPVNCALIGCGEWGREILNTLALLPHARILAVCEENEAFLNRAKKAAPSAEPVTDFRKVLENKEVKAVLIATATHQHRKLVELALAAGKHVYCEAPLAHTIDDARAIARSAIAHPKQYFQSGMLLRSDPQRHFLMPFIRSGALGRTIKVRCQYHKKKNWRRVSPNEERQKALNWRLDSSLSTGLVGEIGLHPIDVVNWFFRLMPESVTGLGRVMKWDDGRTVPDTVQATFEYPTGILVNYEATLCNSFDAEYEMFYGTDSAIMTRGNKAWMFKEVDSPLLGWEVYARKDTFYRETGIALVANATKLVAQGDNPVEDAPYANTPLFYAMEAFLGNAHLIDAGVQDFSENFDASDVNGLKDYLAGLEKSKLPAAGYREAYEATVIGIKANEAITGRKTIAFQKEWFELS